MNTVPEPCPFCKNRPEYRPATFSSGWIGSVWCRSCDVRVNVSHARGGEHGALLKWNQCAAK